jgi:hypothetical protein
MRERLLALCDEFEAIAGTEVADATAQVRASLDQPLRLAVVGRVKAGKSTLVNALLGRRVAPTSEAECTRIVTHYRHGAPERGELHLRDGTVLPLRLVAGSLPDELGVPLESVSHAVVHLPEAPLRDYTLIDTPGLGTTTREHEAATREAMLQTGQADALIYVFRDIQYADDVAFLAEFGAATGRTAGAASAEPSNGGSIGVLSHADDFGDGAWSDGTDPLELANRYAEKLRRERANELGTVLPVAGRLAEAALTGLVTEAAARTLHALRDVDDLDLRTRTLPPGAPDPAALERIGAALGEYGLRHGRAHAAGGAGTLREWATAVSGVRRLHGELRLRYVGRYPQLKAKQAFEALRAASFRSSHTMPLTHAMSEAQLDPALHPLRELTAWEILTARRPGHPLIAEFDRLLAAEDDAGRLGLPRHAAAAESALRARQLAESAHAEASLEPDPTLAHAHSVLARTYGLLWRRFSERVS